MRNGKCVSQPTHTPSCSPWRWRSPVFRQVAKSVRCGGSVSAVAPPHRLPPICSRPSCLPDLLRFCHRPALSQAATGRFRPIRAVVGRLRQGPWRNRRMGQAPCLLGALLDALMIRSNGRAVFGWGSRGVPERVTHPKNISHLYLIPYPVFHLRILCDRQSGSSVFFCEYVLDLLRVVQPPQAVIRPRNADSEPPSSARIASRFVF